jgi:hypothetical protein
VISRGSRRAGVTALLALAVAGCGGGQMTASSVAT